MTLAAGHASYLRISDEHNSTLPPEQQLEPLPYWDPPTIERTHRVLCHLYARGGESRRLAILLGRGLPAHLRWPGPPDAALQP